MADFKAEARNVQDEPGASCYATNKEVLKIIMAIVEDIATSLKGLPLAKVGII